MRAFLDLTLNYFFDLTLNSFLDLTLNPFLDLTLEVFSNLILKATEQDVFIPQCFRVFRDDREHALR